VNPGGHRLEVSASGYPYQNLYFTVQGDTTITVQMVPIEYPDGLELDRPALPQSP
jgi:hypothetical protein